MLHREFRRRKGLVCVLIQWPFTIQLVATQSPAEKRKETFLASHFCRGLQILTCHVASAARPRDDCECVCAEASPELAQLAVVQLRLAVQTADREAHLTRQTLKCSSLPLLQPRWRLAGEAACRFVLLLQLVGKLAACLLGAFFEAPVRASDGFSTQFNAFSAWIYLGDAATALR